jgi:hypothetical protein
MAASVDREPREPAGSSKPEVAEDPVFQRRSWAVERAGWVAILLLLAAGLLGLCGSNGPLNRATAGDAGGPLSVEYARLARHGAPTVLHVTIAPPAATAEEVRLAISRDFLDSVGAIEVLPEPLRVELTPDAYVYVFSVAGGGAPLAIAFEVEPRQYGFSRGTIGLPDRDPLPITQFVFP